MFKAGRKRTKKINETAMYDCVKAHRFCANHKEQLAKDNVCGCFYCGKIFNPAEIQSWLDDEKGTAVCPYCGIDAVIGESSGFPISEAFLDEMYRHWYG